MKKLNLLILSLIFFTSATEAVSTHVGGYAGLVSFEKNFKSDYVYGLKGTFVTKKGFIVDGTVNYFSVKSKNSATSDLKMASGMASVNYVPPFLLAVKPYVGASLGIAEMSKAYDAPTLIYGFKGGVIFPMTSRLSGFVEIQQLFAETDEELSKSGIDINPLSINFGVSLKLFTSKSEDKLKKQQRLRKKDRPYNPVRRKPLKKPKKEPRFGR